MTNYQLVNPYIEGDFEKVYSGKKPLNAAEKAWNKLSGYVTGNLPRFAFTMERMSDKKLFHFVVKEKLRSSKSNTVDFSLDELSVKLDKNVTKSFKTKLSDLRKKASQAGGKRKKDDSDSSSDSDDEDDLYSSILKHKYRHMNQPILYWWYTPTVYDTVLESVYVPTFVVPLAPYVEIYPLSSALFPH